MLGIIEIGRINNKHYLMVGNDGKIYRVGVSEDDWNLHKAVEYFIGFLGKYRIEDPFPYLFDYIQERANPHRSGPLLKYPNRLYMPVLLGDFLSSTATPNYTIVGPPAVYALLASAILEKVIRDYYNQHEIEGYTIFVNIFGLLGYCIFLGRVQGRRRVVIMNPGTHLYLDLGRDKNHPT